MPSKKFLLVDKCILPDYYEKVIEARALLSSGKVKDVSEAVKSVGISRSTYYKYKDYVFALNSDTECRKAIISLTLSHKAGILSEVLGVLSENGANILTITQNLPINSRAHVVISLDISELVLDINHLIEALNSVKGVSGTKLVSIE
ncbi:MAG: ACT domain-containing protein [Clostridia bacterium]|nr:ACT domain-containing protein [Clostridia bacterium]